MERLQFNTIPPDPKNEGQMLAWNALVALVAHGDRFAEAASPVRAYVKDGYPLDPLLVAAGYKDPRELRFARVALGFKA